MTFQQELASWNPFTPSHKVNSVPVVGKPAPRTRNLQFPRNDEKPAVVVFLRHCGCPFAEKSFKLHRKAADENKDIDFIAISHSDQDATSRWAEAIGGAGKVEVTVDHEKEIYGAYGLGLSSFWHNLNPWNISSVIKLGRTENIGVRPTESGSRWQTAGLFAMNKDGLVSYAHVARASDDMGNLEEAVASLKN